MAWIWKKPGKTPRDKTRAQYALEKHGFKQGDVVKLKTGTSKLTLVDVLTYEARGVYNSSKIDTGYRPIEDFVHWDENHEPQRADCFSYDTQETDTMTQTPGDLFVTKSIPLVYGTFVGKHGTKIVLAMKGDDTQIRAFEADEVEEVRPYTIAARPAIGGSTVHMEVPEGSVQVDDVLIHQKGEMLIVVAIDTKARTSMKFKGRKLVTADV